MSPGLVIIKELHNQPITLHTVRSFPFCVLIRLQSNPGKQGGVTPLPSKAAGTEASKEEAQKTGPRDARHPPRITRRVWKSTNHTQSTTGNREVGASGKNTALQKPSLVRASGSSIHLTGIRGPV